MSELLINTGQASSDLRSELSEAIDKLVQLRPMPGIATQLMNVCQSNEPDLEKIIELIECDPSVSLRTLQMVNSPAIGASREIVSIPQAIVMLGFRRLSELAGSIAAAAVFSQGRSPRAKQNLIFEHSLGCAIVARYIAAKNRTIDPSIAFLAGMLHDIGKLVLLDFAPADYSPLISDDGKSTSVEREQTWVGSTHCDIGLRYGEKWGLPSPIKAAILRHHEKIETGLVRVVADANRISKLWGIGSRAITDSDELVERDLKIQEIESQQLDQRATGADGAQPESSPLFTETVRQRISDEFESLKQICCAS